MLVVPESSAVENDQPGITVYDSGFPVIGAPRFKGTDSDVVQGPPPMPFTQWTDLDYTTGGEVGAVDRNAYLIDSLPMPDAHDFRGDHAVIPQRYPYGAYGDAGEGHDDYATQYSQGIASNAYPDVTTVESWDEVSQGF